MWQHLRDTFVFGTKLFGQKRIVSKTHSKQLAAALSPPPLFPSSLLPSSSSCHCWHSVPPSLNPLPAVRFAGCFIRAIDGTHLPQFSACLPFSSLLFPFATLPFATLEIYAHCTRYSTHNSLLKSGHSPSLCPALSLTTQHRQLRAPKCPRPPPTVRRPCRA